MIAAEAISVGTALLIYFFIVLPIFIGFVALAGRRLNHDTPSEHLRRRFDALVEQDGCIWICNNNLDTDTDNNKENN